MKSGISNDYRTRAQLREELGLHSTASDTEVVEALLRRLEKLEQNVSHLEAMRRPLA